MRTILAALVFSALTLAGCGGVDSGPLFSDTIGPVPVPGCPVPDGGAEPCDAVQQAICDGTAEPYCIPFKNEGAICCKLVAP